MLTARPEFTAPWPAYAHVTTVSLNRLDQHDGAALVQMVTKGKALPKAMLDQILDRADGVPLFIEELTKAMLESGLMREDSGGYVLVGEVPPAAVPATLHASLLARLDRHASAREDHGGNPSENECSPMSAGGESDRHDKAELRLEGE